MNAITSQGHQPQSAGRNVRSIRRFTVAWAVVVLMFNGPTLAQTLPTNLVSQSYSGETANGESRLGAISGTGFDAVFTSTATNLIAGEVANPAFSRIYLHRQSALLRLRSISRGLGAAANGDSRDPSLSRDAQHVVFASDASNLISNDNNQVADIFAVFADSFATQPPDPALTVRLSTNEFGDAPDGSSRNPVISGNGRHVLFESRATNLDPGSGISRNHYDLFVVDRDTDRNGTFDDAGTLRPVRIVQFETGLANPGAFRGYDLSEDGRYVVFSTAFSGVTADPVTASYNLYFHDRDTDVNGIFDEPGAIETTLLSRDMPNGIALSLDAEYPEIDADSLRVVFHSRAPEIQTVCASGADCSIFILDIPANGPDIRLPESATLLRGLAGSAGRNARLNRNGSLLTYTSALEPVELRLHNILAATETPLCLSQTQRRANRGCGFALAGQSAQFVALESISSNLVPLDVNARSDVFIRDTIATVPPIPASTACDDQIDNNGNNLIDLEDPGCFAPEDNDEAVGDIVKLVPVSPAASRIGAYTVIDQQGRPGESPDFALSPDGLRQAAYSTAGFADGVLPIDELRTSLFDPFAGRTTVVGRGIKPSIAADSQNRLHLSYGATTTSLAYTVDNMSPPQVLSFSCTSLTGYFHTLLLSSTDAPIIPNWDVCSNDIKIWRPGISTTVIATPQLDNFGPIDAAISLNDEYILAYNDNRSDGTLPDELVLARLNSLDQVLAQQRESVPQNPVSLDVRTDASGAGHVAYTGNISIELSTGTALDPALVYFRESGGVWLREELLLTEPEAKYLVQLRFATDGLTPIFVLSSSSLSTAGESRIRQFTFSNGEFDELQSLDVPGGIDQIALDQSPDGSLEFVYQSVSDGNIAHADPESPAWISDTVSTAAFTDFRDLGLIGQPTLFSDLPTVLTFTAPSLGAAGELILHQRDLDTAQWQSQIFGPALVQDAVDLSESGQMLVQVRNADGRMVYYEQTQPGVWTVSTVVTLTGFDTIDHVHVTGNPAGRVVVYGILRTGDGNSGDVLVAYTRSDRNAPWQQFPYSGTPVTSITEAQARGSYVAYVDGNQNNLLLARFDRNTGQWSNELVDTDVSPTNTGKTVSLQITQWIRSADGVLGDAPTIVYRNGMRDRIRYAMRANGWRIWEFEETMPAGVSIEGLDHLLINDSRLRPLIAARLSDDSVVSYHRAGGASADDADAIAFERELIAGDGSDGGGLGLIRVAQSAATNVAYSSAGKATRLTVGKLATGLPTANPAYAPTPVGDARSKAYGDLASTMCICFIGSLFGSTPLDDYCGQPEPGRVESLALPQGNSNVPVSDEEVLGQWGILFNRTAAGQRYIDFYARDYSKIARLAGQDPGLLIDGVATLQNFMPGIRAMVDGYGDQVFLTQQMIDDGLDIWQRLADRDDGTLSAFIQTELALSNNMQDFVGLTFDQWGTMIGLQVGAVGGGDDIFADSFE